MILTDCACSMATTLDAVPIKTFLPRCPSKMARSTKDKQGDDRSLATKRWSPRATKVGSRYKAHQFYFMVLMQTYNIYVQLYCGKPLITRHYHFIIESVQKKWNCLSLAFQGSKCGSSIRQRTPKRSKEICAVRACSKRLAPGEVKKKLPYKWEMGTNKNKWKENQRTSWNITATLGRSSSLDAYSAWCPPANRKYTVCQTLTCTLPAARNVQKNADLFQVHHLESCFCNWETSTDCTFCRYFQQTSNFKAPRLFRPSGTQPLFPWTSPPQSASDSGNGKASPTESHKPSKAAPARSAESSTSGARSS